MIKIITKYFYTCARTNELMGLYNMKISLKHILCNIIHYLIQNKDFMLHFDYKFLNKYYKIS